MTKIEISLDLDLDRRKRAQVELHSFHNVMNVLLGELQFMQTVFDDPKALKNSLIVCRGFLNVIGDPEKTQAMIRDMPRHRADIEAEIEDALRSHDLSPEHRGLIEESREKIDRVLEVVAVRVEEMLAWIQAPDQWQTLDPEQITAGLKQVFHAVAVNAGGRYGIVFDPGRQGPGDYLIVFDVRGAEPASINVPPMLVDCLRDLTANARKYSDPGGRIDSVLVEDDAGLHLSVSDQGRGIPAGELEKVVGFGVRGSNTSVSETKGGGYGLTKAYHICQKNGGRMWIQSQPGAGTTITIDIPKTG